MWRAGRSTLRAAAMAMTAMFVMVSTMAGPAYAEHEGQKAFIANKCDNCHSIEKLEIERKIKSEKMKGPDLGDVGDRHMAEWMVKFLKREVDLDDDLHKQEYKGSKKDLEAISAWLGEMKKE